MRKLYLYKSLALLILLIVIAIIINFIFFHNKKSFITQKEVREKSLHYFKNEFGLQIVPMDGIVDYCPSPNDYSIPNSISIATCKRNEHKEYKYNLPIFHMLYAQINNNNIVPFLSYLKYFCKADMSKLGIVSITNNNELGLQGIEPYIPIFNEYGIINQNILIRQDVDAAYEIGSGDGYWRNPYMPSHRYETFSVYYPLTNNSNSNSNSNIVNYADQNKWLELGEGCFPNKNINGFGIGMERIEYVYFSIPFPAK